MSAAHALLSLLAAAPLALPQADAYSHPAVLAYRSGDFESAATLWRDELEGAGSDRERARLAYDLGNCAYRDGRLLDAVGWYTACLRLAPRHADAWYNLELVRGEAGLEPADRGDLDATLARLLSSLTLAESEWLLLACLGVLAVALLGEAWLGRVTRPWIAAAGLLVLAGSAPWLWNLSRASGCPMLVVGAGSTSARSEPDRSATALGQLSAGEVVRALDSLPEWTKVHDRALGQVWVRSESLFDLSLGQGAPK